MDNSQIGEKIYCKRTERKINQDTLAKEIAISQSHLSDIEAGKVSPKWDEIVKIADVLQVPLQELIPLPSTQVFNCSSQDTSQQFNGNIIFQIPLQSIIEIVK